MTEPHRPRPLPARPQDGAPGAKPTPVRELSRDPAGSPGEPEAPEASLEVEGTRWTVRVTGRSGSASGVSPPLMLLGFWKDGSTEDRPGLEALVAATSLQQLSEEALEQALSTASEPPLPDRKRTFFADAGQGRRRSKGSG